MIDSHCHLDHCADPSAAADPNLRAMVSIGTTVERCRETLRLAERFGNVWAAVGIHPTEANDARDPDVRAAIAELAEHPKVVAIGETGIDYYWDAASAEVQRDSFVWQAELAASLDKPLILHVRDKQNREQASLDTARLMSDIGWNKGILHCFNGHAVLGETGLELDWFVSFAGNLTYKKSTELHDAARNIPRDRLLVETDSPFLTPVPKRGERNVPANVRHTAAFLAELRGETLDEVEAYTDANAIRVYDLPL
ncbi:MAG: TatD family hydrolase [Trueperaceae bacterium]|nr:TatD family hydrolase [Trueperaceae bacterium]